MLTGHFGCENVENVKKTGRQDIWKRYVAAGLIFAAVVAAGLIIFLYYTQKDVEKIIEQTVNENVSMQSHQLKAILDAQYDYLEGVAGYLGQQEELICQESLKLIQNVQAKSGLERVMISDAQGEAYYDDGNRKNVAERRYFQEGMSGQRTLSDPLESKTDGQTRVVLGVPIWKEEQVIGILGGSYDVTALSKMMFQSMYDGEGFSFILTDEGEMVSCDGDNTLGLALDSRLFSQYEEMLDGGRKLDEIQEDFLAGRSGFFHLKLNGERFHLAYVPLGYNNWMVCYAINVSKTQQAYNFIKEYETVLICWFIFAVLVLLVAMLKISGKKQNALMRYAITDSLTGLYNRKHTEDVIRAYLQENTGKLQKLQAFLIIDIDFFKEINDGYGHTAGDEVLRRVGEALQAEFEYDGVVGRLGGDEFVVFLKDAGLTDEAEKRAALIPPLFRSLGIPELKGRTITCSVGMSYAPVHGQDYLELYRCADIAMYETKKKGRNGYTVYQKDELEAQEVYAGSGYVHRAYTEINPLTGLHYNKAFFKSVDERLKNTGKDTSVLVAIDIEHFSLFNRLYGWEEGDKLLIGVADALRRIEKQYDGIAGYLSGDNFCIFLPDSQEAMTKLQERIVNEVKRWSNSVGFLPGFGVFPISDPSISAVMIYDRATVALKQVYGNYAKRICVYESGMLQKLEEEVILVSEVQEGLKNEEFLFYMQPQCNISGDRIRIVGAECLVRWQHKERGLLTPGAFLPVLEKNGFVSELDRYTWKKVFAWVKSWIERGNTPVPVSVNVSRSDIFSMDVTAYFKELAFSYGINPRLIKIEITESAYAENDERIGETVNQLQEAGFSVMMDDFGSGYSSLSMLKNVAVDVLKTDMHFLESEDREEKKGEHILESVVSMSRQLGLPFIVEGIENERQGEFLNRLGCRYVQGYYYYRPMPVSEFEQLISQGEILDPHGITVSQFVDLGIREFPDRNVADGK